MTLVEDLIGAAFHGEMKALRKLLKVHKLDVNSATQDGTTALHAAAQEGQSEAVRFLLDSGADVKKADRTGTTALLVASEFGHSDCVKQLLDAKSHPDIFDRVCGATSLHMAARADHVDILALLMGNDPQPDTERVDQDAATPLVLAAYHGHWRSVNLLLEYGADANVIYFGKRLIHWTRKMGHEKACVIVPPERLSYQELTTQHPIPGTAPEWN